MKKIRLYLKFTIGLPIIIIGSIMLFGMWFFAWIFGDDGPEWKEALQFLWKR